MSWELTPRLVRYIVLIWNPFFSFPHRNIHYSVYNQRAQEFNTVNNGNTRIQPNVYRWYKITSGKLQNSRKRKIVFNGHGTSCWGLQRSRLHGIVSPKCGSAHTVTDIQIALAKRCRMWSFSCRRTFLLAFMADMYLEAQNVKLGAKTTILFSHKASVSNDRGM